MVDFIKPGWENGRMGRGHDPSFLGPKSAISNVEAL
jgi:hypothetical protein